MKSMLLDLIQNLSLLITLVVGVGSLSYRLRDRPRNRLILGLVFGAVGVIGMMTPVHMVPGIIYDGRSIIIGIAGIFGGLIPTAVASLMCIAYRVYLGGGGMWVGIAVIIESAAIGLLFNHLRRRDQRWVLLPRLLIPAFGIHAGMLGLQLLLPGGVGGDAVRQIGLAVMLGFPSAFVLAAAIFLGSERFQNHLARLADSEERYRCLFEDNHAVMVLLDPTNGDIRDANNAAARFYGWTREQLARMNIRDINTLPSDEVREKIEAVRDGRESQFLVQHRLSDGSIRDVEVRAGRVDIGAEHLLYSTVYDITDQKETEAALGKSQAFQSAVIACSPVALYGIDLEGNILTWNGSAERLFGWSAEEIVGKSVPFVPDTCEAEFASLRVAVSRGESFTGRHVRRLRKDGSVFDGRLSTAPIMDGDGNLIGIMGAMEDISESKRLEETLRQAQKMESVGRLAGGVAHDFNNMLGVILGHTELIIDRIAPDDAMYKGIEEIQRAAQRSADLTRQLLAFARRQTVAPKLIDIDRTIASMLQILRRLINENIKVAWTPLASPKRVLMDPSQLDQVVANLVVNARDAIGDRPGTIEVRTDVVARSDFEGGAGRYVRLTVSDDGRGIDEGAIATIFEPFFTTKKQGEGTGLGLATVHGIVEQNRGRIEVESTLGVGTRFHVFLRVHDAEAVPEKESERHEAPRLAAPETLLLVEDEVSLLRMTEEMLGRLGYRVLTASTPDQAIRAAEDHRGGLRLLITDVVMPEMSGPDLYTRLRAICPALRCLYISGYAAELIVGSRLMDEGSGFVQKPFSMKVIDRAITEMLAK